MCSDETPPAGARQSVSVAACADVEGIIKAQPVKVFLHKFHGGGRAYVAAGLALCVDYAVLEALLAAGAGIVLAQFCSLGVASALSYGLNGRTNSGLPAAYMRPLAVLLLAFLLRTAILASRGDASAAPQVTVLAAIVISGAMVNLGSRYYVFSTPLSTGDPRFWTAVAIGACAYVIALRFAFLGSLNLLPEEAYYWNYSQHLDIGYLDHPPMVAWLISLGVHAFGNSEFAVRSMVTVCWLITAIFTFLLTRNLYGKNSAVVSLLLVSVLPFFFSTGLVMLPDAPLTAAWAAALFFLERALVGGRTNAWLATGVAVGLGFLSKYSIVLLGPAALVFLLFDRRSRVWLRRPAPYIGGMIALLVASPVIIWNFKHNWASFQFQSSRRIEGDVTFSLHKLIASVLFLLTPVGLIAGARALAAYFRNFKIASGRRQKFAIAFTAVPLSVFVFFSLFHSVKLNWTGPIWLALVPWLSWQITTIDPSEHRSIAAVRRAWEPTAVVMLLAYGVVLNALTAGLPGVNLLGPMNLRTLPSQWKSFSAEAESIERSVHASTGNEPVLVGMDKYFVSSELAFYDTDHDGASNTAGRSLFGFDSLMYDYWFKPADLSNRDMILIGLQPHELTADNLAARFAQLDPIKAEDFYRGPVKIGAIYYRVGHGYIAR